MSIAEERPLTTDYKTTDHGTTDQKTRPKAALCRAAQLLCHVAVRSHTLRDMFEIEETDGGLIHFFNVPRPWLEAEHPSRPSELTFNADAFAKRWVGHCSSGENQMVLWILNVWNPGYARGQGWTFDLFRALDSLDGENREAIAGWLLNPVWP